jgi:hypothetical protein
MGRSNFPAPFLSVQVELFNLSVFRSDPCNRGGVYSTFINPQVLREEKRLHFF